MEKSAKRSRTTGSLDKKLILSFGENLLIWRRRQGWNQSKAAKYFKISVFTYKMNEYGKVETIIVEPLKKELETHEKCLIYRKRSGKKQKDIAHSMGICRDWLRQQETGEVNCTKLLAYWEDG